MSEFAELVNLFILDEINLATIVNQCFLFPPLLSVSLWG